MKVCFVSTRLYYLSSSAGIETLIRLVSRQLMRQGHEVLVITTTPDRARGLFVEEKNGIRVYNFYPLNIYERYTHGRPSALARLIYNGIDLLWNPQPYRVIKRILAQEKPHIVHIHNWRGLSLSLPDAARSLGIPLVYTAHDYFVVCPKASLLRSSGRICVNQPPVCRLYKTIRKFAMGNKLDLVTTPSQFVIDELRGHRLFQDTQAVSLPNAIGLEGLCYSDKEYDIIDVLYVGPLLMHKGVHILIDAFKQLGHRKAKLHIVGEGLDAEKFKGMAGSDSRIVFHGFVPEEELILLYKRAHVTVVPSIWYETFGRIIIESFKYGTPVVASRIGAIPETVEDGYNGLLFEPGNVAELKDVLESLIENPSELKRLGQGAFESVKKYDIKDYVVRLEELYEQLIR